MDGVSSNASKNDFETTVFDDKRQSFNSHKLKPLNGMISSVSNALTGMHKEFSWSEKSTTFVVTANRELHLYGY